MKKGSATTIAVCLFSLVVLSGCGGVGLAVVGTALGISGNRGLEYYDSGETTSVLYVHEQCIETAVVQAFKKLDYTLATKYLLSGGEIEYEGFDNKVEVKDRVEISVIVNTLGANVNEVTISARKDLLHPEKSICHVLMSKITTIAGREQLKRDQL